MITAGLVMAAFTQLIAASKIYRHRPADNPLDRGLLLSDMLMLGWGTAACVWAVFAINGG